MFIITIHLPFLSNYLPICLFYFDKSCNRKYPSYNFYHLKYDRFEVLDFNNLDTANPTFIDDFIHSMANLFISIEADAFVGALTSHW